MTVEYQDRILESGVLVGPVERGYLWDPAVEVRQPISVVGKSFLPRAAAYVIDWFTWVARSRVVLFSLAVMAGTWLALNGQEVGSFDPPQFATTCVSFLLGFTFFVLCEWLYGATPGKALLRMRVVKVAGGRIRLPDAVVRHLARLIDSLFFGLVAYGSMKAPAYQRLGDRWAHTVVRRLIKGERPRNAKTARLERFSRVLCQL